MSDHAEVEDILAHYGVKGMKWGVRKDRSRGRSKTPRTPAQKRERQRKAARAAKIAIGAAAVAIVLHNNRGRRPPSINTEHTQRLNDFLKKQSSTNLREAYSASTGARNPYSVPMGAAKKASRGATKSKGTGKVSPEAAKWLKDFSAKQSAINRAANADLKAGYNRNQTPFPLREYLDEWG